MFVCVIKLQCLAHLNLDSIHWLLFVSFVIFFSTSSFHVFRFAEIVNQFSLTKDHFYQEFDFPFTSFLYPEGIQGQHERKKKKRRKIATKNRKEKKIV